MTLAHKGRHASRHKGRSALRVSWMGREYDQGLRTAAVAPVLASSAALAQRAGDTALGAVGGAIVLGPVGAVAGAFVGYTGRASISGRGTGRLAVVAHRRQSSGDSVRGARAEP